MFEVPEGAGIAAVSGIEALKAGLAPAGLNLAGIVARAEWDAHAPPARRCDALLPGARAIVVIGNGGGSLWNAFVSDLAENPQHLCDEPDPLDAFVRRAVARADAALGAVPRRWFYAAATETMHLDFRMLGWLAGLGARSRLGLLLHPVFGPWVGLRAACFVDAPWHSHRASVPDPCTDCPAPCVTSCPGAAFPGGQWSVDRCAGFKSATDTCRASCAAREACPVGAGHRYPDLAIAYHNHRASGRGMLADAVGIAAGADRFPGDGPHWNDWRARIDVRGKTGGT